MVKNDNFNDDEIELVHELAKLFMLKEVNASGFIVPRLIDLIAIILLLKYKVGVESW